MNYRTAIKVFSLLVMALMLGPVSCIGDSPPTGGSRDDGVDASEETDQGGSDSPTVDVSLDPEPDETTTPDVPGDSTAEADPTEPDTTPDTGIDPLPDIGAMDSDGDTILDQHEGFCWVDTDEDGTPDCRDLDSDDDGIPDALEAGDDDPLTPPVDTDHDNMPDFQDLDSDADGIFDEVEGTDDSDGDGDGNWVDRDSDGDNLLDSIEGTNDFDNDLIPDYLDVDSDNDWIPDWLEGVDDTDHDDLPDRFDDDSDDDGWLDSVEVGDHNLTTPPLDTDEDGDFDFRDLDSDGDGLADGVELGCGDDSTNRLLVDTDADTFSDMAEVAVGSDPCSASSDVYDFVEFFFILPPDEEVVSQGDSAMEFSTDLQQIDVSFNVDCTGSMGGEIARLKCDLTGTNCASDMTPSVSGGIISAIASTVSNSAFGLTSFRDFPISPFGGSNDWPYRLDQAITTTASSVQTKVNALVAYDGADVPESGYESLYQIATGSGLSCSGAGCGYNIPVYSPPSGRFGGVGFRNGSFPFVVHITDAFSHQGDYQPSGYSSYPSGWNTHNNIAALNALTTNSVRVIGVASQGGSTNLRNELEYIANATDAVVPVCAFDGDCGTDKCCTGLNGGAIAAVGGRCPLVFTVDQYGSGLGATIVDAIDYMARNITMTVTTEIIGRSYPLTNPTENVNSACFITRVEPDHFERDTTCGPSPEILGSSFINVTAGTQVFFRVIAENDGCVEPRIYPMLFEATINIWGDGIQLLDTLEATIIIPPTDPGGPK